MFDLARIDAAGFLRRIDYHPSIGSTNDRAMTLAAASEGPFPLLVLTERQTAGRGRGTNTWWATEGSLTFSLALEAPAAQLPVQRFPEVAIATGLAVCEAIGGCVPGAAPRVKWPNDVYLSGRKVCGILCETATGGRDRLVVGIGVNVNNRSEALLPAGGASQQPPSRLAVSLVEYDGVVRDLTDVLLAVLDQFERRWDELLSNRFASIAAAYREQCLLTGQTVTIEQAGGRQIRGVCRGIDAAGALRLVTAGGEERVCSGTVVEWRQAPGER